MTTQQDNRFYDSLHAQEFIEFIPMHVYPPEGAHTQGLVAPLHRPGQVIRSREEAQAICDAEQERVVAQIAQGEALIAKDATGTVAAGFETALASMRGSTFVVYQRTVSAATPAA